MPRLSALGSALMGAAGAPLSIDGATPATFSGVPAGYFQWYTNTVIFGQAEFVAGTVHCYTYDVGSTTLTLVDSRGANWTIAGGGVWAAWLGGTGVFGSLAAFTQPLGYAMHTSYAGETVLLASYASGSGLNFYNSGGTLIDAVSGTISPSLPPNSSLFARDGLCAYNFGAGYLLRDYLAQTNLSILQRGDMGNWMVPVVDGTDVWVLERTTISQLTIRKKDSTTAWVIEPSTPTVFAPDVMRLSAGVVRVAWSTTAGEGAGDLIVVDLTLATGANTRGVVVGSALVFTPQAALGTMTVSGSISPGGGGGGGGVSGGGSPGRAVINARVVAPPPVRDPRRYPHVDQIADFPTRQTTRLVWDQLGSHQETLTTVQATVASHAAEIAELRATIAKLTRTANATYKGAGDT